MGPLRGRRDYGAANYDHMRHALMAVLVVAVVVVVVVVVCPALALIALDSDVLCRLKIRTALVM